MRISLSHLTLVLLLSLVAGCEKKAQHEPAIAEAFAGPITLNLREELNPKSKIVGTAKHGDKLDVLQARRRFIRVRTAGGVLGWTDARNLLSAEQMKALRDFATAAKTLPSQGRATVYATLNIHSEPSRQAPSIYQIPEGGSVEVLAHKIAPRVAGAATQFTIPKPPPPKRKKKEPEKPAIPPPPKPAAPKPPPNWLELSKTQPPPEPPPDPEKKPEKAHVEPVRMEDWSLVRSVDGKAAGWVLTRMLTMAIPDEVAQYSEGRRIVSYYSLGKAMDAEQGPKDHWLWTTMSEGPSDYDFDSFRVFIWNVRRHRYETAYIERDVKGYLPAEITPGSPYKFGVLLEYEDGKIYKKTFSMEVWRVPKLSETPASRPPELTITSSTMPKPDQPGDDDAGAPKPSIMDRLKALVGRKG